MSQTLPEPAEEAGLAQMVHLPSEDVVHGQMEASHSLASGGHKNPLGPRPVILTGTLGISLAFLFLSKLLKN